MSYIDTPAPFGALKMPSRDQAEQGPRRFQPYPSTRYHPDGGSAIVNDLREDGALGAPWSDKPYPPPPAIVPPPEPTLEELKAAVAELTGKNAALQAENDDMRGYIAEMQDRQQKKAKTAKTPAV